MGIFSSFIRADVGIDLGTCNTLVAVSKKGIVIDEPSVVVVHVETNKIIAVGKEAHVMLHRTPGYYKVVRPLRDGVIADLGITERMIRHFMERVLQHRRFISPRIAIGVPSCITDVEKRAVVECAERAGARQIRVIHESLAAAIGADLPIYEPEGNMICDIGGGTTEISVLSLGGMVISNAIRIGGDEFDDAIIRKVRNEHNMTIRQPTAEKIKINIGTLDPGHELGTMEIRGRDALTGLPKKLEINSKEIFAALMDPFNSILDEVKKTLAQTPDELVSDIIERGIVLAGGGALLKGIDIKLAEGTGVPVIIAKDPLRCVAEGAGKYFEHEKRLKILFKH